MTLVHGVQRGPEKTFPSHSRMHTCKDGGGGGRKTRDSYWSKAMRRSSPRGDPVLLSSTLVPTQVLLKHPFIKYRAAVLHAVI